MIIVQLLFLLLSEMLRNIYFTFEFEFTAEFLFERRMLQKLGFSVIHNFREIESLNTKKDEISSSNEKPKKRERERQEEAIEQKNRIN